MIRLSRGCILRILRYPKSINMAVPLFVRFSNLRSILRINNNVIGTSLNTTQFPESVFRSCSTTQNKIDYYTDQTEGLSKAMRAYLQRAQKYEAFMKQETLEYETGKRHLANIMGLDPEHITQQDIDRSLEYLFPSGLYDPKARPIMKHPTETFPPQKEAEFAADGKPFHFLFYTSQPNYYETLHNIVENLQRLDDLEDKYIKSNGSYPPEYKFDETGYSWITKSNLEKLLIEKMSDENYEYFIKTLNKLQSHRLSKHIEDFITKYKKAKIAHDSQRVLLPVMYNDEDKPYVTVFPCQRKSAVAKVIIWGKGTGKITINGKDISYFHDLQCREQVSFSISILFNFCFLFIHKSICTYVRYNHERFAKHRILPLPYFSYLKKRSSRVFSNFSVKCNDAVVF